MHEISLAESIVDLVRDQARRDAFTRVRTIHLAIGALSHVDPHALAFGFDAVSRGTVAEGAALAIDRPSGAGYCMDCARRVPIAARGDDCPSCGGHHWVVVGGDEMRVVDLEVE